MITKLLKVLLQVAPALAAFTLILNIPARAERLPVVVWHNIGEMGAEALGEATKAFEAVFPSFTMAPEYHPDMINELKNYKARGGKMPDVIIYYTDFLPFMADEGMVSPLSQAEAGLLRADDFFDQLTAPLTYNGELYGLPMAASAVYIFSRKDAVLENDGIMTLAEDIESWVAALPGRVGWGVEFESIFFDDWRGISPMINSDLEVTPYADVRAPNNRLWNLDLGLGIDDYIREASGSFPRDAAMVVGAPSLFLPIPNARDLDLDAQGLLTTSPDFRPSRRFYALFPGPSTDPARRAGALAFIGFASSTEFATELSAAADFLPVRRSVLDQDKYKNYLKEKPVMAKIVRDWSTGRPHFDIQFMVREFDGFGNPSKIDLVFPDSEPRERPVRVIIQSVADDSARKVLIDETIKTQKGLNVIKISIPPDLNFSGKVQLVASVAQPASTEAAPGFVIDADEDVIFSYYAASNVDQALGDAESGIGDLEKLAAEKEKEWGLTLNEFRIDIRIFRRMVQWGRDDAAAGNARRGYHKLQWAADTARERERELGTMSRERAEAFEYKPRAVFPYSIKDAAFTGPDGPAALTGGCGWGDVVNDFPNDRGLGFNSGALEIGPSGTLLDEGKPNTANIRNVVDNLKNAEQNSVSVMLLVSPHYFPGWGFERHPELKECAHGFIGYCINDPYARKVLSDHLRFLIPAIRDSKALHSYCLANEPQFDTRNELARKTFIEYVKNKYKTLDKLNAVWGTKLKSFDEVKIPPRDEKNPALRYDWLDCHYKIGTDFFKFLKDEIRKYDKTRPVHVKFMQDVNGFEETLWGIDREALGREVTEINGCDGGWSYEGQAGFYDLLMSINRSTPVYNTEYHIIPDNNPNVYSFEFIHSIYWQGLIHGQSATDVWVWAKGEGGDSSLMQNILHRPEAFWGMSKAAREMDRLAPIATRFAAVEPEIKILFSRTSKMLSEPYTKNLDKMYRGLLYQGQPVGYAFEATAEKDLKDARLLVVPGAEYVTDEAAEAIRRFVRRGGKLVIGAGSLSRDEAGRERNVKDFFPSAASGPESDYGDGRILRVADFPAGEEAFQFFADLLERWKLAPEFRLLGVGGEELDLVEYRTIEFNGKRYLFVLNESKDDYEVGLHAAGGAKGKDLISNRSVSLDNFVLNSETPMLIEF